MRQKTELHEYQQDAISYLYEHNDALALLPVGAGKSVIGWTAAQELMRDGVVKRTLVFAPMRVAQLVWPNERFEWEHLKDEPIVAWGGEPATWADSIWKESRVLWGQVHTAEARLPGVEKRVLAQMYKEQKKLAPNEPVIYGDLNPNEVSRRIDEETQRCQARLTALRLEQKKVDRKARSTPIPEGVLHVTSYENLLWVCDLWPQDDNPFDLMIFDEIGKLKNPKSPRYKAVRKQTQYAEIVWGLNATPAPEGFEDLFSQVQIVAGSKIWGKSFYEWRMKYFAPTDYQGYDWRLQMGAKELLLKDLNRIAFKVDESELKYQQSMQHSQILVELPLAARTAYAAMEKEMMLTLPDQPSIVAMSAAATSMKLRQITQGFIYDESGKAKILHTEKADALSDLLDSLGREPLLIAYEFTEDLEAIRRVWKNIPYLGQGISAAKAADTVERWNNREFPALALHPFSAGHGLNLQKGGCHICWYAAPWPLESWKQTNGRIDRQGQTKACYGHTILAANTVDQRVWEALTMKDVEQRDIINAIRNISDTRRDR